MTELEKRTKFKELMLQLDVYYSNFKFFENEERDKLKLQVWYKALQVIPSERLEYVVNDYCIHNVFAPNSPTSLIEHYRNIIQKSFKPAEEVFEKLIKLFDEQARYSVAELIKGYEHVGNYYVVKVLERMKSDFEMYAKGNKPVQFLKKDFCDIYNEVIKSEVETEKLKLGE